ncbi:MAG: PHB depolymerase family esterase [Planctomycetaceae bacterium]
MTPILLVFVSTVLGADPLGAGDHTRSLTVDGHERSYFIHIPPKYDSSKPTPVVLILHGAGTNDRITVHFTGMNSKSDEAGFVAAYPNGTGTGPFLTWNAGGMTGKWAEGRPDDVKFVARLLEDLATVVNVDSRRVYATGMSNGGMMCYRLAAELSERIAAIAPVAGTMAIAEAKPKRPVPVLHFHGTADTFVSFEGPNRRAPRFMTLKSVDETVRCWCEINGCPETPTVSELPNKADDGMTVKRKSFGPGKNDVEVVLFEIDGGGHTWPGQKPVVGFIGRSTLDISANDLIWEFFQKHPMK